MASPILANGFTYRPLAEMIAAPGDLPWVAEDRSSMSFKPDTILLKSTFGAYFEVGGRNILIVVDEPAAAPGSDVWTFIHDIAARLVAAYPALDRQARDALARLEAVIFAKSPERSFADVRKGRFFYDTDEFLVQGGSRKISTSYAASNIVHDANHVWLECNGQPSTGLPAEVVCWQLQVDNQVALGLAPHEVAHLQGFIDNPETAGLRIIQPV